MAKAAETQASCDHMNRRISSTGGMGTTYFHYQGATANVIAETDDDGAIVATYAYDAGGRLHSMTRGGETYYYQVNAHGDVVALTDESGAIVNEYAYDPYGASIGATETVENPYRYASYRYDAETDMYYCWNRYYDSATYRFVTADLYPGELADPASMNAYAYCMGSPINLVDPQGLSGWGLGLATLSGVLAAAALVATGPVLVPVLAVAAASCAAASFFSTEKEFADGGSQSERVAAHLLNAGGFAAGAAGFMAAPAGAAFGSTVATPLGVFSFHCSTASIGMEWAKAYGED